MPVLEMSLGLYETTRRRFGWLAIPFVYGDTNVTDEVEDNDADPSPDSEQARQRSKPMYTGAVASINFFFLVTSSLFVVSMTPVMKSKQNKNVILENVSVQIVLIISMIVGVFVKLLFVIFRDRVAVRQSSKLFNGVYKIIYAMGLIIFYIIGCIFDIFHVIAKVTCDQIWRSCDHAIYKAYVVDVMFYLTKIIYFGGSVLFTLVFYRSKFLSKCLVRYGLMFLLSTYLTIWFDLFLRQSRHIMRTEQEKTQSRNLTVFCLNNISNTVSNLTL